LENTAKVTGSGCCGDADIDVEFDDNDELILNGGRIEIKNSGDAEGCLAGIDVEFDDNDGIINNGGTILLENTGDAIETCADSSTIDVEIDNDGDNGEGIINNEGTITIRNSGNAQEIDVEINQINGATITNRGTITLKNTGDARDDLFVRIDQNTANVIINNDCGGVIDIINDDDGKSTFSFVGISNLGTINNFGDGEITVDDNDAISENEGIDVDGNPINFLDICLVSTSGGGGNAYQGPTIGLNNKGMPMVKCGVMFGTTCFDITSKFHFEFELYEMMSGTHTISITSYCAQGVDKCNYVSVGISPNFEDINNQIWKVSMKKDHLGNWTLEKVGSSVGEVSATAQTVGTFVLVSFTIEFLNIDSGTNYVVIEVRDSEGGVQITILNEGIEIKDAHAYPYVQTAFEAPLKVEPLCIGEDVFHRNTCAFDKVKEWATNNAEETMRQILNNEYTYK